MGNCVAGGGYLPVLCDKLLMTEGSGLYLAGPALVKAAIGQTVSHEDLGGADDARRRSAAPSTSASRTTPTCLERLRRLIEHAAGRSPRRSTSTGSRPAAERDLLTLFAGSRGRNTTSATCCRAFSTTAPFDEYKAEYGQTLVCGYGRLGGVPVGVVANQRKRCKPADGPLQYGGVIYVDSADKAARFIMDCNQTRVPILFLQDVNGFMVGRDSEQAGIIRAGAKLVNAIANSVVPKITRHPRRLVRRRQLRPVRQGVRPAVHLRLADGPLRRHGRRAGGRARCSTSPISALKRGGHEPDAAELEELRRKVEGELRRADRHPLRRGPAVGGRDHRAGTRRERRC